MAVVSEDFQKLVLDDIKTYAGLSEPVKAGVLERMFVHNALLKRLHPNPEDEFSMTEVGPHYGIVGDYLSVFKRRMDLNQKPYMEEKLMVEKMSTGGYMILNGHHRWMAACRLGIKKAPVQIVNVTPEKEIFENINNSDRLMCVSFDFDEVLLTDGIRCPKDKNIRFPLNRIYKKGLRKNAGVLANELQKMGFDVWIYTGNYHSTEYINGLMKIHKATVNGIVNGLGGKKGNSHIKEAFVKKYKYSIHVDNDMVLCVNTTTKEYESVDIDSNGADWSAEVINIIRGFNLEIEK